MHFSIIQTMIGFRMFKNDRMFAKCVGNVPIAAPHFFPFLMSRGVLSFKVIQNPKLPTTNIKPWFKGPVKERGSPVNNLKCGTDTITRNLSHTIPQDIWMNERINQWLDSAGSDGVTVRPNKSDKWDGLRNHESVSECVSKASSRDASASKKWSLPGL